VAVIVMVLVPLPVMVDGLKEALMKGGKLAADSETLPEKPPVLFRLTVLVPVDETATLTDAGFKTSEKLCAEADWFAPKPMSAARLIVTKIATLANSPLKDGRDNIGIIPAERSNVWGRPRQKLRVQERIKTH
jgi:hypothetical protein